MLFVSTNLFVHFDGIHNQVNDIEVFHQFKILLWKQNKNKTSIARIEPTYVIVSIEQISFVRSKQAYR